MSFLFLIKIIRTINTISIIPEFGPPSSIIQKLLTLFVYNPNKYTIESDDITLVNPENYNIHTQADAMAYMTSHLGGDRGITRSFLTKIALYVNDKRIVELSDVEKCLPDTGAADIDDFLYSLTAGNVSQTMMALDRLLYDNKESNMLVRMLTGHFKKLQTAVVDGQLPNLFWKVRDKFNMAIKIWPETEIVGVLVRLNELERQLRTTGMPAEILLRDFALKLSVRAAKLAAKRRN